MDTYKKMTPSYNSEGREQNSRRTALQAIQKVKESIPSHLCQYIVDQYQTQYSSEDQAVWRYVLRQLKNYLQHHADDCYLEGLEKTGITVNEIPSIDEICIRLQEFGWSAVPVSGFIPPAAFMELQSLGILPIASDMRSIESILYTPAPDIVHEAAGHAPILVDQRFAEYLKSYAQVAKNALVSKQDLAQYEAIRELSDIKENPLSTPLEIEKAEEKLESINRSMSLVSEAALLGRMNWWTAEYGLIGDLSQPKIYGAGLLSSVGEAKNCLSENVEKIPLTVDCVDYSYDITEMQPQLFVAQSFDDLPQVLDQLADRLAYRRGGTYGMEKAIECETVNTAVLNSGLQISGIVDSVVKDEKDQIIYYRYSGPTQLCIQGKELPGHDKTYHGHGFSAPLGLVENFTACLSEATEDDLKKLGLKKDWPVKLTFASGIRLEGEMIDQTRVDGKLVLLSFTNCKVYKDDQILFDPSWGQFDMAIGKSIDSVFSGPADREAYGITDSFVKKTVPEKRVDPEKERLYQLYTAVRLMRKDNKIDGDQLVFILKELKQNFPNEWLIRLEMLELIARGWYDNDGMKKQLTEELEELKKDEKVQRIIEDGLAIAPQIF